MGELEDLTERVALLVAAVATGPASLHPTTPQDRSMGIQIAQHTTPNPNNKENGQNFLLPFLRGVKNM
jgi:hypothetical protein